MVAQKSLNTRCNTFNINRPVTSAPLHTFLINTHEYNTTDMLLPHYYCRVYLYLRLLLGGVQYD